MKFSLVAPSGYGKHETGGEHAVKHMHDPYEFCDIRQMTFGDRVLDREPTEILRVMQDERDGGLLNVLAGDMRQGLMIVGGAYYHNELPKGKRVIAIDSSDFVLSEEHRSRGVGAWLLSRLMTSGGYYHARGQSQMFATDLCVTDESRVMTDWMLQKAHELGMADVGRSLHYNLPGPYAHVRNSIDRFADTLEQVELRNYTGSIPFDISQDEADRRFVFRDGKLIGWVQAVEALHDEHGDINMEYQVHNALDGTSHFSVEYDDLFAITALLNTPSAREQIESIPE